MMTHEVIRPYLKLALSSIIHQQDYEKYAYDLGFGNGDATSYLLKLGWSVCAVDVDIIAAQKLIKKIACAPSLRCLVVCKNFCDISFKSSSLVHASYSMQYVEPSKFNMFWQKIKNCIIPGGVFAGHIFGLSDNFAEKLNYSVFNAADAKSLFDGFDILMWDEYKGAGQRDRNRYWHFYTIVARRCCAEI